MAGTLAAMCRGKVPALGLAVVSMGISTVSGETLASTIPRSKGHHHSPRRHVVHGALGERDRRTERASSQRVILGRVRQRQLRNQFSARWMSKLTHVEACQLAKAGPLCR